MNKFVQLGMDATVVHFLCLPLCCCADLHSCSVWYYYTHCLTSLRVAQALVMSHIWPQLPGEDTDRKVSIWRMGNQRRSIYQFSGPRLSTHDSCFRTKGGLLILTIWCAL